MLLRFMPPEPGKVLLPDQEGPWLQSHCPHPQFCRLKSLGMASLNFVLPHRLKSGAFSSLSPCPPPSGLLLHRTQPNAALNKDLSFLPTPEKTAGGTPCMWDKVTDCYHFQALLPETILYKSCRISPVNKDT